jgi:hypothetical protein
MNSFVNSVFRVCEKKWVEIFGKYSSIVSDKKMVFDIEAQQFVGENGIKCDINNKSNHEEYFDWKYKNMDNDEESKIIILIDH